MGQTALDRSPLREADPFNLLSRRISYKWSVKLRRHGALGNSPSTLARDSSGDRISERLHPSFENSLGKPAGPTQDKGAEVLVPIAVWGYRAGAHPSLEGKQIDYRDAPFIHSLQQVMPDATWKIRKLNLRQPNPSQRWHGSDRARPHFCAPVPFPRRSCGKRP